MRNRTLIKGKIAWCEVSLLSSALVRCHQADNGRHVLPRVVEEEVAQCCSVLRVLQGGVVTEEGWNKIALCVCGSVRLCACVPGTSLRVQSVGWSSGGGVLPIGERVVNE